MNKITVGLVVGLLLPGITRATCTYNFDAHPTQLAMYSLLEEGNTTMIKPLATSGSQRVSIALPDVPQKYMAISQQGVESLIQHFNNKTVNIGDITVLSTGKLAVEFTIDQFTDAVVTSDNSYRLGVLFYGSSLQTLARDDLKIEISLMNSFLSNRHEAVVNVILTALATGQQENFSFPVQLPLPRAYRLGLYLDQDNQRLGVILNDQDKGYLNSKIPVHVDRLAIAPFITTDLDPTNPLLGQVIAGTIITDARYMKLAYPAGTRDICGITLR